MKSIEQRLDENYILGCIKHNDKYQFYLMPIAWWILNYEKYSPSILQDISRQNFRNGALNVTDDKLFSFFGSISEDQVSVSEANSIIKNFTEEYAGITFFIDFDKKEYISIFDYIEVETYLPDTTWIGKYANPIDYIPKNILNQ
ncbi:hypothetical protein LF887_15655 [Chryseobacterium sp. MEBOG06]|uniref:hypothetical protein n=1 Tax=Chryseobacterium sp. MEBOG06 TaxID=2879938 RepID=UPI001F310A65|nr:hypothetical protein [Chryseobacterium sp. MEBOG06]UKB82439.1 hypothetical protein LF887_15655 [Chryseobacterium sp. MEBOG06]